MFECAPESIFRSQIDPKSPGEAPPDPESLPPHLPVEVDDRGSSFQSEPLEDPRPDKMDSQEDPRPYARLPFFPPEPEIPGRTKSDSPPFRLWSPGREDQMNIGPLFHRAAKMRGGTEIGQYVRIDNHQPVESPEMLPGVQDAASRSQKGFLLREDKIDSRWNEAGKSLPHPLPPVVGIDDHTRNFAAFQKRKGP